MSKFNKSMSTNTNENSDYDTDDCKDNNDCVRIKPLFVGPLLKIDNAVHLTRSVVCRKEILLTSSSSSPQNSSSSHVQNNKNTNESDEKINPEEETDKPNNNKVEDDDDDDQDECEGEPNIPRTLMKPYASFMALQGKIENPYKDFSYIDNSENDNLSPDNIIFNDQHSYQKFEHIKNTNNLMLTWDRNNKRYSLISNSPFRRTESHVMFIEGVWKTLETFNTNCNINKRFVAVEAMVLDCSERTNEFWFVHHSDSPNCDIRLVYSKPHQTVKLQIYKIKTISKGDYITLNLSLMNSEYLHKLRQYYGEYQACWWRNHIFEAELSDADSKISIKAPDHNQQLHHLPFSISIGDIVKYVRLDEDLNVKTLYILVAAIKNYSSCEQQQQQQQQRTWSFMGILMSYSNVDDISYFRFSTSKKSRVFIQDVIKVFTTPEWLTMLIVDVDAIPSSPIVLRQTIVAREDGNEDEDEEEEEVNNKILLGAPWNSKTEFINFCTTSENLEDKIENRIANFVINDKMFSINDFYRFPLFTSRKRKREDDDPNDRETLDGLHKQIKELKTSLMIKNKIILSLKSATVAL